MIQRILDYVRDRMAAAVPVGGRSEYGRGYVDAMEDTEEFILDLLWEEGEEA